MDQVIRQLTIAILIPLPFAAFWLWMFRDMLNNRYLTNESRTTWTWEFILLNFFAAMWYYLTDYKSSH
jgi:sterol desaturase/sphingolipid hydroxylase (fatty acid hydroxylase superfamily)